MNSFLPFLMGIKIALEWACLRVNKKNHHGVITEMVLHLSIVLLTSTKSSRFFPHRENRMLILIQTNNNLSNGSVLANFSCMKDNEANLCNGYNYANGRFCFNYRGAKSKITDYVFGDGLGTGGAVAKLSDLVKKDDLGVTEYNAGKSIEISGRLSDIGKWLQTNGTTSRWMSVRANPTNTDGYFGRSTFSILWQCSSDQYGWCILISDNLKMVVFGRNSDGWHWYAPSLTEVS